MTTDLLSSYQDEAVGGIYRLGKLVHASGGSAVYETEYGEAAQPALIELRQGGTPQAERRLALWRQALDLSHPHLLRLYAADGATLDGVPVIYLVLERADESLAGVLAERTLSEEEAREMLEPTLSALNYLHKSGYAHAALGPTTILAAGEVLKLATSGLERVDEGGRPADDMWALAAVLVEALTGNRPMLEEDSGPYILLEASEPVSGIVRHCLDPDPETRWTSEQARAHLHPSAVPIPVPAQEPVREFQEERKPVARVVSSAPPLNRKTGSNKWMYGAAAALVLVAAVVGVKRNFNRVPSAVPAPTVTNAPAQVAPTMVGPAVVASSQVQPSEKKTAVHRSRDPRLDGWAVVVASYGSRGPAEKRVRELGRRWPKFSFDVFEPGSEKARHLVVVGKNLSEEKAEALRKRALASGLPRDTYIKRFAGLRA